MFSKLQARLSPDEWLHGKKTGTKVSAESVIPLHEYPAGVPEPQLRMHVYRPLTPTLARTKAKGALCLPRDAARQLEVGRGLNRQHGHASRYRQARKAAQQASEVAQRNIDAQEAEVFRRKAALREF